VFYYRLGSYGYECSDFVTLANDKEFTESEFEQCVIDVTPSVIAQYIEDCIKECNYSPNAVKFDDIDNMVVEALCNKYGFQKVTPVSTIAIWKFLDLCRKYSVNEYMDTNVTKNIRKAYMEKYVQR